MKVHHAKYINYYYVSFLFLGPFRIDKLSIFTWKKETSIIFEGDYDRADQTM